MEEKKINGLVAIADRLGLSTGHLHSLIKLGYLSIPKVKPRQKRGKYRGKYYLMESGIPTILQQLEDYQNAD